MPAASYSKEEGSGSRLRAEWKLKCAWSIGLSVFFCLPYFVIQRFPVFPIHLLPLTWLDLRIDFDPRWVYMYQSVYLLLPSVPWLAASKTQLQRYRAGFIWLSLFGFLVWFFLPIAGPRPSPVVHEGMYGLLVGYDRNLNTFPSLHVGLAAYTILFGCAIFPEPRSLRVRAWLFGAVIWGMVIVYSTLATKQHYAVDLPAGILLAWVCHQWAWRRPIIAENENRMAKPVGPHGTGYGIRL